MLSVGKGLLLMDDERQKNKKRKPGPKTKRLTLTGDWRKAAKKALKKKRPKKWPKQ